VKKQSLWFVIALAGILGGSFMAPLERLQAAPAAETAQAVKVNVNKASAVELESIRGIGPMLAERIVKFRDANGRFERLEDLVKVPGIGEAKFEKIREQVTL